VCYFLAIGVAAEPWRLAALLEESIQLDVDATAAHRSILAAFPPMDVVRLVTHRGCSCNLLAPLSKEASCWQVSLTSGCRRVIAQAVNELGAVRLYVRTRKHPSHGRLLRHVMTLDEFVHTAATIPTNALVEVVARIPAETLN
jgi:hypothetical protein